MKKGQEKHSFPLNSFASDPRETKLRSGRRNLVSAWGWCCSLGGSIYLHIQIFSQIWRDVRQPQTSQWLLEEARGAWTEKLPRSRGKPSEYLCPGANDLYLSMFLTCTCPWSSFPAGRILCNLQISLHSLCETLRLWLRARAASRH